MSRFSFGTRIHGNIAALLAGTPALLLAHDPHTLELAEYHEIPHRTITSIGDGADAVSLNAECDWNRLNKAHPDRWDTFASFLEDHRLPHVYQEGQDASAFYSGSLPPEYPPPVRALMGFPLKSCTRCRAPSPISVGNGMSPTTTWQPRRLDRAGCMRGHGTGSTGQSAASV